MRKHTIPTMLNSQESIIFGLNSKQVAILFSGAALGYLVYLSTSMMYVTDILIALIPFGLALPVALTKPYELDLDLWLLYGLLYLTAPRSYIYEFATDKPVQEELHIVAQIEEEDDD